MKQHKNLVLISLLLLLSTAEAKNDEPKASKSIRAQQTGLVSFPSHFYIQSGDNNTVFFSEFDNSIKMQGPRFFDWDWGNLTAYNAPKGEYKLTFTDRDNHVKVVRISVLDSYKKDLRTNVEDSYSFMSDKSGDRKIEVFPGESIEDAIKDAVAGDEILVHGGIYHEKIDAEHIEGSEDKWIKISNYPGEIPVLYPYKDGKAFNLEYSQYVQINGFTIKEPKGIGIRLFNLHDIIVSNNEVYGLGKRGNPGGGAHAIVADGRKGKESHDILITGNYLHHNLTRFPTSGNKTDDETLTIKGAVSYSSVENNRVVDNQFIGIDIIGPDHGSWGKSHHNVVRNNYVARNGGKYGDAIYIDGGSNHIVEHNTVEDNSGSGISTSQEIEGQSMQNIIVRKNAIGNQKEDQFYIGDTSNSHAYVSNILFEDNYIYAYKGADNAHIGVGSGDNLQLNDNYFELEGDNIIRKVHDAGSPNMSSNSIGGNTYSNEQIKSEIEGLGWGSVSAGRVGKNTRVKEEAGADLSLIPTEDSSVVLGDKKVQTTRLSEAGHRIKL